MALLQRHCPLKNDTDGTEVSNDLVAGTLFTEALKEAKRKTILRNPTTCVQLLPLKLNTSSRAYNSMTGQAPKVSIKQLAFPNCDQ